MTYIININKEYTKIINSKYHQTVQRVQIEIQIDLNSTYHKKISNDTYTLMFEYDTLNTYRTKYQKLYTTYVQNNSINVTQC